MKDIIERIYREDKQQMKQLGTVQFRRQAQRDKSSVPFRDSTSGECSSDDSTTTTETMTESISSMLCIVDTAEKRPSEPASIQHGALTGRVSFGDVRVREYKQVLSYNPACSKGAAIEIGWNYRTEQRLSVDEFESQRSPPVARVRLLLSKEDREAILGRQGYSAYDLASAECAIMITQRNRMRTIRRLVQEEKKKKQKKSQEGRMRGFSLFWKRRQDAIAPVLSKLKRHPEPTTPIIAFRLLLESKAVVNRKDK